MEEEHQHTEFRVDNTLASRIEDAYRSAGEEFVVADLGCGKGLYHEDIEEKLDGLGDKDVEIIGFDIDRELLEYTDENETALADLTEYDIPLKDSSVDFIYSNHLACQIEDEEFEEIENEAERVLKEGGRQYHPR